VNRWAVRAFGCALGCLAVHRPAPAQTPTPYKAPRNGYGQPDLEGIWEARNTAAGSLEAHTASFGIRAGRSVIVDPADGKIPYQPSALAKRDENYKRRAEEDPLNKCYSPGVPRMMYIPFPVQIFQTPGYVAITSEFAHTTRIIYMQRKTHYADAEFWMGDSLGHWDGDTLVVDVGDLNAQTWLDKSGDYHSEALRVVERFTRTAADVLTYEATITDPKVYTRPWTIRMPLYKDRSPDAQIFEYECHAYLPAPQPEAKKQEVKP